MGDVRLLVSPPSLRRWALGMDATETEGGVAVRSPVLTRGRLILPISQPHVPREVACVWPSINSQ